ncbi:hypothetical protein FBY51_0869 [Zymomonas mobilis]|nr:hypothetical protein FBY53_0112 [Zymomonas mobilis]TQL15857.1 hypothetical protein FBY51_0869 [Zymomonas mobilis]
MSPEPSRDNAECCDDLCRSAVFFSHLKIQISESFFTSLEALEIYRIFTMLIYDEKNI